MPGRPAAAPILALAPLPDTLQPYAGLNGKLDFFAMAERCGPRIPLRCEPPASMLAQFELR